MPYSRFKKRLRDSIKSLHDWRVENNGEEIGCGYDELAPDRRLCYPHAYALWGRGYIYLHQTTGKKEYLNLARKSAEWLIENKNPYYRNHSWGLPLEWQGTPSNLSYLVTSIYAGNFFLELYKATKKEEYLETGDSIAKWVIEENGYIETDQGIWFRYANYPKFTRINYCVVSMTGGFFAHLNSLKKEDEYLRLAQESIRYLLTNQYRNGFWQYTNEHKKNDNGHMALTTAGLCDAYSYLPDEKGGMKDSLLRAYNFYRGKYYRKDGFGYEAINLGYRIKSLLLSRNMETRLYGYGTGIWVLTKMSQLFGLEKFAITVAEYAINNLQTEEGVFKFKSDVHSYYIRNEAHIFDGLTYLLTQV